MRGQAFKLTQMSAKGNGGVLYHLVTVESTESGPYLGERCIMVISLSWQTPTSPSATNSYHVTLVMMFKSRQAPTGSCRVRATEVVVGVFPSSTLLAFSRFRRRPPQFLHNVRPLPSLCSVLQRHGTSTSTARKDSLTQLCSL